ADAGVPEPGEPPARGPQIVGHPLERAARPWVDLERGDDLCVEPREVDHERELVVASTDRVELERALAGEGRYVEQTRQPFGGGERAGGIGRHARQLERRAPAMQPIGLRTREPGR